MEESLLQWCLSDPGSFHHVILQSSAPRSRGSSKIGLQSKESFPTVWLPLCREQFLLLAESDTLNSLKQNLILLVFPWKIQLNPPCLSPKTDTALRTMKRDFSMGKERISLDGGWSGDLGGVQGSSHKLFCKCGLLRLRLSLSMRKGTGQMPDGVYLV